MEQKEQKVPIYRICLTGGPCAGKTTALTQLKDHLTEKGFKVFVVPEVPTLTMEGGGMIIMGGLTQDKICQFQGLLMKAQMDLEDYFYNLAVLNGKPSVILMDRGVMDPKGYMDEQTFQSVLDLYDYNQVYLRDKRYDVVIHMVTAADGAEKFYTLENNAARYEDVPTAKLVDQNLLNAWTGHPHHLIVDNGGSSFQEKITKVINGVEKFIGISSTNNLYKKFLVDSFQIPSDVKVTKFDVEETYLECSTENMEYQYIRKRGNQGAYSYALTQRFKDTDSNHRRVIKTNISSKEYIVLQATRNNNLKILKKERYTFLYDKQSYILETFQDAKGQTVNILKVDTADTNLKINPPEWIKIGKEISDDSNYSSINLAKIQ